ncbi:hypothetical protein I548_4028 [Mycobacterium intracellulare]|nr:hypothetical protein I548_4028 [Mycobacterium intracellulare]
MVVPRPGWWNRGMTKYAAFLRGVNVGGVNLKMAEVAPR